MPWLVQDAGALRDVHAGSTPLAQVSLARFRVVEAGPGDENQVFVANDCNSEPKVRTSISKSTSLNGFGGNPASDLEGD